MSGVEVATIGELVGTRVLDILGRLWFLEEEGGEGSTGVRLRLGKGQRAKVSEKLG